MVAMVILVMVVGVNVTTVIRTMRKRMVRSMVRTGNRKRERINSTIDIIATSDDFRVSRCNCCKGGKNESNENFELHNGLEY